MRPGTALSFLSTTTTRKSYLQMRINLIKLNSISEVIRTGQLIKYIWVWVINWVFPMSVGTWTKKQCLWITGQNLELIMNLWSAFDSRNCLYFIHTQVKSFTWICDQLIPRIGGTSIRPHSLQQLCDCNLWPNNDDRILLAFRSVALQKRRRGGLSRDFGASQQRRGVISLLVP